MKLTDLLQVTANVAIIVGLVMVGLQMRQNEKLLKVQILNQYNESYIAADLAIGGEDIASVWQKSHEHPEDLSLADLRILETHSYSPLLRWINLYRLHEAGIADDKVWKTEILNDVSFYYGTRYGRVWWDYYSEKMNPDFLPHQLRSFINDELATTPEDKILQDYREIQKRLRESDT